jgi:multiple sugar transport system permease protein
VSIVLPFGRLAGRRNRLRRSITELGSMILGAVILVWSVTPIYNMLLVALDPEEGEIEFDGNIWPPDPSLEGFRAVVTQEARYLEDFWHQFGNSLSIGLLTMSLTVLISSLASFSVSRMRLSKGSLLTNAALLTYVIPASLLIIPIYRVMYGYGLLDNLWAVIASQVTFASPFAILILRQYARLIPFELDEAARIDGASAVQMYLRIYLPLMTPALAVVAIYALARLERLYLSVRAARLGAKHDRLGDAGAVVRRRRRGVERHDGRRDHLCAAACCDLLCAPPLRRGGIDDGRREWKPLKTAIVANSDSVTVSARSRP